ncbi:hypothetical protein [Stakelama tenebrarum]|uniref:Uncharacterized protein n=1 Tax=Stakelama tenebrarum TaxID=2711215 RepID=A0A6G6Y2K3_9SPHN|nr:hypothetical protein [Sphingosinithalassobacter tenebrarum]QIG78948.1 hypothetical protein G5C33_03535 [Sphingosinithalassobacter tenebrarum]
MLRRILVSLLLLATGAVFGPVLVAAAQSAMVENTEQAQAKEARQLLDAYRSTLEPMLLLLSIVMPSPAECGYDKPDELLPNDRAGETAWSNYMSLDIWRGEQIDDRYLESVAEYLDARTTTFEAAFLRRCIESTVFASVCANEVKALIDGKQRSAKTHAPPERTFESPTEDRIICTFLDGIAAQKGIPLAER